MAKTSMMLSLLGDLTNGITALIGELLYNTIGRIIILLLDWFQSIFRGLAGLEGMRIDGVAVNGEGQESYDIAYWLISTDIVMDIFWSMLLFSVFLLIIMTILALIRNTYEDKQKPVWDIISASFKGLFGFILVPALVVVGLMFSNVILRAIDAGTSFGNSTKMSTNLFMSSAYDANLLRQDDIDYCRNEFEKIVDGTNFEEYEDVGSYYSNIATLTLSDYEILATKLDNAFTAEAIKNNFGVILSPYTAIQVGVCYNTWKINYIILLAGGCTLIGVFFKMCWGMIGRIFKICFDFVLIPVVNAMMPFDNGNAMKSWKGDFVKNVTMAYGTVGALNLYFSILPIVNKIEFNNGGLQSTGLFNSIFKLMISIVGVFSANAIINTVNGWFGVGNVLAEGDSTLKAFQGGLKSIKSGFGAKDKIKKGAKKLATTQGAFLGGLTAARKDGKQGFGAFLSGARSAFDASDTGKAIKENRYSRNVASAKKSGQEAYGDIAQNKGTIKDMFHANTDYNDRAKAEADLKKNFALFDKTSAGMNYKQQLKALYGMADMKAILENGGYNIDGSTSTEYLNTTTGMETKLEKDTKGQEALESFMRAKENQRLAFQTARSMKVSEADIRKYLGGDTSALAGKNKDQIDALNEILKARSEAEDQAKDAAIYLSKSSAGLAGTLASKKEADILGMDSSDLASQMEKIYTLRMDRATSSNNLDRVAKNLEDDLSTLKIDLKARQDKQEETAQNIKDLMDRYYKGTSKLTESEKKLVEQILTARSKMK